MDKTKILLMALLMLGYAFAAGDVRVGERMTAVTGNLQSTLCNLLPVLIMLGIVIGAIVFPILAVAAGILYYLGLKNAESKAKFHKYAKILAICAIIIVAIPVILLVILLIMPYILEILIPGANISCGG